MRVDEQGKGAARGSEEGRTVLRGVKVHKVAWSSAEVQVDGTLREREGGRKSMASAEGEPPLPSEVVGEGRLSSVRTRVH